jgi:hypothetical protein
MRVIEKADGVGMKSGKEIAVVFRQIGNIFVALFPQHDLGGLDHHLD